METDSNLVAAVDNFMALKARKEEAEEKLAAVKQQLEDANKALLDVMDALNTRNFDMGEYKYYVKTLVSAKVNDGAQEQVKEWLKSDPEGSSLVKEQYDSRSLGSFLAERVANGGAMPPKELITDPMSWSKRMVATQKLKVKG